MLCILVMSAMNEILQKLSKQSKDIIELQQSVNSIQQQVQILKYCTQILFLGICT